MKHHDSNPPDNEIYFNNAKRLIGQVAHDIRVPITQLGNDAISIFYKLLREIDSIALEKSHRESLKKSILDGESKIADRMAEIEKVIQFAIDLAHKPYSRMQVSFTKLDLFKQIMEVAREAQSNCLRQWEYDSKVVIKTNQAIANETAFVGDESLLKIIFFSLISNAIKYSMPRGKGLPIEIRIDGNPQEKLCIVRVTNWGTPIHPDQVKEIFKPFHRGNVLDRVRAKRGMGLGLYVALRNARIHGGDILVTSSPTLNDPLRRNIEGWDTTFEVRLPRSNDVGVKMVDLTR